MGRKSSTLEFKGNPVVEKPRIPGTQAEIIALVYGADEEKLFWLRSEEALRFCVKWLGTEEAARKAVRQSKFWDWFLGLWGMTDRKILSKMDSVNIKTISWKKYVEFIRDNQQYNWRPDKVLPGIEK